MKFWAKIKNSALKGIILLNIQTLLKNNFQSTAKQEKNIETQEQKLKQQRTLLKYSMTENQCITFASYKISMQIAKCQRPFIEGEFLKQCSIEICKPLFSSYSNYADMLRKNNLEPDFELL